MVVRIEPTPSSGASPKYSPASPQATATGALPAPRPNGPSKGHQATSLPRARISPARGHDIEQGSNNEPLGPRQDARRTRSAPQGSAGARQGAHPAEPGKAPQTEI